MSGRTSSACTACAAAAEILSETEADLAASDVEDKRYTLDLIDETRATLTVLMAEPAAQVAEAT